MNEVLLQIQAFCDITPITTTPHNIAARNEIMMAKTVPEIHNPHCLNKDTTKEDSPTNRLSYAKVANITAEDGSVNTVLYKQKPNSREQDSRRQIQQQIQQITDGRIPSLSLPLLQPPGSGMRTLNCPRPSMERSHNNPKNQEMRTSTPTITHYGPPFRYSQPETDNGLRIRGIKQEKGVALYLENIAVDEANHDEICKNVKIYAKNKGIRIMTIKAIRNRYCEDVIGCKIMVPESHEHIALNLETWPQSVHCRRWEQKPRRQGRYNEREYTDNYHNGAYNDFDRFNVYD